MKKLFVIKSFDLRQTDPDTGKKIPIPIQDYHTCDCCGTKIAKIFVVSSGGEIGSECAVSIDIINRDKKAQTDPKTRKFLNVGEKQFDYFEKHAREV